MNKLLKFLGIKRICPQCGGSGKYYSEGMARDHTITEPLKCSMCNGDGKVKRQ